MSHLSSSGETRAFSVTQYALLLVLGVSLVSSLLLGNIVYKAQQDALMQQRQSAQRSVESVAGKIEQYLQQEAKLLRLFVNANLETIAHTLGKDVTAGDSVLWPGLLEVFPNLHNFTFADRQGQPLLKDPEKLLGTPCPGRHSGSVGRARRRTEGCGGTA